MHLSAIDQAFWLASFAVEVLLFGALILKRQYLVFPIFCCWMAFDVVSEFPLYWIPQHWAAAPYQHVYIVVTALDFTLQLGVLFEIAQRVLRPGQRSTWRNLKYVLPLLIVAFISTLLWSFSKGSDYNGFSVTSARLLHVSFVFSFLRLILFAMIAGFSQMLGITWRNHVIRLATGLAFYSAVSLVTQLTISHLSTTNETAYLQDFHVLTHIQTLGYLLALLFWTWSFVQKDAPRREFSPQMERFLVTMSQTARRNRVGFARNLGHK